MSQEDIDFNTLWHNSIEGYTLSLDLISQW
jgi:hypothetical protein